MEKKKVINQKAWQLNTGTTYAQVSRRIADTQKIKVADLHYILFILTVYAKFKYNEERKN